MSSSEAYAIASSLKTEMQKLNVVKLALNNSSSKLSENCFGKITDAIIEALKKRQEEIESAVIEMNSNVGVINSYAHGLYLKEQEAKRIAEELAKKNNGIGVHGDGGGGSGSGF